MITEENHLHDINLIKKAVESIFTDIKAKFSFIDYNGSFVNSYDSIYVAIEKKEIIIYVFISKREAYELSFLKKGEDIWKRKTFSTLVSKIYPPFSKEEEIFFKQQYDNSLKFEKYSYEWYCFLISKEIQFTEKFFPEILKLGKLSQCELS